jgi:spore coat polysaccharide biosynthesis protein SpsF
VKAAILIAARLKSTRLPRKVLKPIHGRPMLGHMFDRLRLARGPDQIILCTSTVAEDDPLEEFARGEGVACFRGHPDDVLLRLTDAAVKFDAETVINATADNPFVDPEYIDRLLAYHGENGYDFTKIHGLPWGTFSYALNREAMRRACELKDEVDTEVWGGYFTGTGRFKCGVLEVADEAVRWPELRLTVDTPEDFDLVSCIFDELYEPGKVFPLRDIVALCRRRPDLTAINAGVGQKPGIAIKTKAAARRKDR